MPLVQHTSVYLKASSEYIYQGNGMNCKSSSLNIMNYVHLTDMRVSNKRGKRRGEKYRTI